MSIASPINQSISAEKSFSVSEFDGFFSSTEDVLAVINKISSDYSKAVLGYLKNEAANSNGFSVQQKKLQTVLISLNTANPGPIVKLTPLLLHESPKDKESLSQLFYPMAYRLGINIQESESLFAMLNENGVSISPKIEIPVLETISDNNNEILSENIYSIGEDERSQLAKASSGKESKEFPGAIEFSAKSDLGFNKVITVFGEQANYSISENDFFSGNMLLQFKAQFLVDEFSKSIEKISAGMKSVKDLEYIISQFKDGNFKKIEEIVKGKIESLVNEINSIVKNFNDQKYKEKIKSIQSINISHGTDELEEMNPAKNLRVSAVENIMRSLLNEKKAPNDKDYEES